MHIDPNENKKTRNLKAVSVDRIKDDGDYELGNIILTTRFANFGRNIVGYEDTISFMSELISHLSEQQDFTPGVAPFVEPAKQIRTLF